MWESGCSEVANGGLDEGGMDLDFLAISSELHYRTHLKLPWLLLAPLLLFARSFFRWHSFRFDLRQFGRPCLW